jgi:AcrR family transcriptional regulator
MVPDDAGGRTAASRPAPADPEKPHGPRSRKGVETRARLLDAAKQVFAEDGFLEARTTDIAARAGVSHGAFYHYFQSKEEIFREVAELQQDRLSVQTIVDSGLLDSSPDLTMWQRLRESNRRYLEGYRDDAGILGVIEQVSRYDEHVGAARFERQSRYTRRAEDAIRRLQRQHQVDPRLDATIAANALSAMVSRFAEMWFVEGELDCDLERGVDQLTLLCLNALQLTDASAPDLRTAT